MKNILKEKLKNGDEVIGTFVTLPHPDVTELLSRVGFDWLLIDNEHTITGLETMATMLQAMNGTDCTPIVRPQWNDMVVIKRILDIGAHGVLIPWVNNREQAEYAVRACKYPPAGLRGYGPRRPKMIDPDYLATANDEIMVIVQIETREAVANVNDILSVDGIDACYIGPFDLSLSYGNPQPKWDDPDYLKAFDIVLEAAAKAGKPAGMFATSATIGWAKEKGLVLNTIDDSDDFLKNGALEAIKKFRS